MPSETQKVEGQTGATCTQSGPYRSDENAKVIIFIRKGDTFPPASTGSPTTWVLLTAPAA